MSEPVRALRAISFVAPHQRATTGGVHAIHQFARLLSQTLRVSLIVQRGETHPMPGVEVVASKRLRASQIPDADAILVHADCRDLGHFARLPISKGAKMIYLQGFGTPGNPVVIRNLERRYPVIASATWLAEEAAKHGAPATFVPYGLDSQIFRPPAGDDRATSSVVMMTHDFDWKGMEDGLAALRIVRERRPDTEVVLFGTSEPDFPARFVSRPSREEVAQLFRANTLFVCPSWEEGFGMPGLEALACGCALATTDTKGSRDYALHGETALVSPPKDPARLAESIVQLLENADLRKRLAKGARRHVAGHFASWPETAPRFRSTVEGHLASYPVALERRSWSLRRLAEFIQR